MRDHKYLLIEFNALRKNPKEDTSEFIKRFNKQYNNLPDDIKPPATAAHVVFMGVFEFDIGFSLRERNSLNIEQLQTDALEVEANMVSVGKSKVKKETIEPKRWKEESSSSGQDKQSSKPKWDELEKLVRSLTQKVGKLEIENKNLSIQNFHVNNRGYNPQYKRPQLQLLPRERKEQLDQTPHPLYLEDGPDEQSSDTQEMQGNVYSTFSEEEYENMSHQETNHDREETTDEKDRIIANNL